MTIYDMHSFPMSHVSVAPAASASRSEAGGWDGSASGGHPATEFQQYYHPGNGFVAFEADTEAMTVTYYDMDGQELYNFSIPPK